MLGKKWNPQTIAENIITNPDKLIAQTYFELNHNEEFGIGEFVDKSRKINIILFMKSIFHKKKREELKKFLQDTTWSQGYLAKNNLLFIKTIYNFLIRRKI